MGHTNGIHWAIEEISPEVAAEYLERNHARNRMRRDHRVRLWAEEMRQGRWQLTHQGIAFNREGDLVDGQHRLAAVIDAGVPVRMSVCRGLDVDPSAPLDQGLNRTLGELLGRNPKQVAAMRHLYRLRHAIRHQCVISIGQVQEIIDSEQEASDAVFSVGNLRAPTMAALMYAYPIDRSGVLMFAEQVRSGELLKRNDPAFMLRAWLERNKRVVPWSEAMAALNATRHALGNHQISSVHTGEMGYQIITSRRRALRIANTPGTDLVSKESKEGATS